MQSHRVLWNVSLSNGENFRECSGRFEEKAGEPSPWQKLLAYLEETGARITALWLSTPTGAIHHLPSSGRRHNPLLKAFDMVDQPKSLRCFRRQSSAPGGDAVDLYTIAEAVFENYTLQIFVSERDASTSWVLVT